MGRLTCWTPLVVLAVFLCHLQLSAACSCIDVHPQSKFCRSDFVALVTVEEFVTVNEAKFIAAYTVNVNQTFKATPSARIALDQKSVRLWTRSSGGLCGLTRLSAGETWVVGGYMVGSDPHVDLCDLSEQWSSLTPLQRDSFQQLYGDGCVCEVTEVPSPDDDDKICYWAKYAGGHCQRLYGVCMVGSKGCSWIPSVPYDECVKLHPLSFPYYGP